MTVGDLDAAAAYLGWTINKGNQTERRYLLPNGKDACAHYWRPDISRDDCRVILKHIAKYWSGRRLTYFVELILQSGYYPPLGTVERDMFLLKCKPKKIVSAFLTVIKNDSSHNCRAICKRDLP
jgi:hypothetical protein